MIILCLTSRVATVSCCVDLQVAVGLLRSDVDDDFISNGAPLLTILVLDR
jgi:hypothetical protein